MALDKSQLYAFRETFLNYKDLEYVPIDFEELVAILINRIKENLPNTWTDFLESNFRYGIN